jgi:hypothetical protein
MSAALWLPTAGISLNTSMMCRGKNKTIAQKIPCVAIGLVCGKKTPTPSKISIIPTA